jgi:hypothetical protein
MRDTRFRFDTLHRVLPFVLPSPDADGMLMRP